MIATLTLYRTADGKLVREGDPRAAFLLCRAGCEISPDVEQEIAHKMITEPEENKAAQWPAEVKRLYRNKRSA